MIIENYVCTLEQSKKLGELGFNRGCLFCWAAREYNDTPSLWMALCASALVTLGNDDTLFYPAYSSQDIEEAISGLCFSWNQSVMPSDQQPCAEEVMKIFHFSYLNRFKLDEEMSQNEKENPDFIFQKYKLEAKNEVIARAEFLIYLLEKKSDGE
jgi:hypothetical protein